MATTGGTVTVEDLAAQIGRLEAYPEALERRVRGVCWMLWGLVLGGVFFTYDYVGLAHSVYGGGMWPLTVIWIPWVGLGTIATLALWKANGLAAVGEGTGRRMGLAFLAFGLMVFAFFVLYHFSGIWRSSPLVGPSVMLTLVGLGAVIIGISGFGSSDRTDKMLWILGGFALIIVVILGTLAVGSDMQLALRVFGILGPLATTAVYFGNGLYLTLRG